MFKSATSIQQEHYFWQINCKPMDQIWLADDQIWLANDQIWLADGQIWLADDQIFLLYSIFTHDSRGTKGGVFKVLLGQPFMEPGIKFEGSFISIHRPSNLMLSWNWEIICCQYFSEEGLVKSGKTVSAGHTWERGERERERRGRERGREWKQESIIAAYIVLEHWIFTHKIWSS